jgi:hypothetical protein
MSNAPRPLFCQTRILPIIARPACAASWLIRTQQKRPVLSAFLLMQLQIQL